MGKRHETSSVRADEGTSSDREVGGVQKRESVDLFRKTAEPREGEALDEAACGGWWVRVGGELWLQRAQASAGIPCEQL